MVCRSEIKSRCPPSIGRFMANVRLSQMAPLGWSGPSVPVFVSHFWLTAPGWSQNCHLHLFFRHSQFPSTASTHWKHIHTKVFVSPQYWLMEIVYVTLCAGFKCNSFVLKWYLAKHERVLPLPQRLCVHSRVFVWLTDGGRLIYQQDYTKTNKRIPWNLDGRWVSAQINFWWESG